MGFTFESKQSKSFMIIQPVSFTIKTELKLMKNSCYFCSENVYILAWSQVIKQTFFVGRTVIGLCKNHYLKWDNSHVEN